MIFTIIAETKQNKIIFVSYDYFLILPNLITLLGKLLN